MPKRNPFEQKTPAEEDPPQPTGWNGAPLSGWGAQPAAEETPPLAEAEATRENRIAAIPTATWESEKRVDNRKRAPVFFVRNVEDIKEPLLKISDQLGIPRDMLVRYMLEYGLEQHFSGTKPLVAELDQRLTLYPQETVPKKRKGKTAKGTGFRGLPNELVEQIRMLAQNLSVPIWQVVRRFLEQGLDEYRTGELQIEPVTITTETFTLYP